MAGVAVRRQVAPHPWGTPQARGKPRPHVGDGLPPFADDTLLLRVALRFVEAIPRPHALHALEWTEQRHPQPQIVIRHVTDSRTPVARVTGRAGPEKGGGLE